MTIEEKEQLRVLSKCSPELLKITGKHSKFWNYSKLETMEKLSDLLTQHTNQLRERIKELKKEEYWVDLGDMKTVKEKKNVEHNKAIDQAISIINKVMGKTS
jgi:hypothetical protein